MHIRHYSHTDITEYLSALQNISQRTTDKHKYTPKSSLLCIAFQIYYTPMRSMLLIPSGDM